MNEWGKSKITQSL